MDNERRVDFQVLFRPDQQPATDGSNKMIGRTFYNVPHSTYRAVADAVSRGDGFWCCEAAVAPGVAATVEVVREYEPAEPA